MNWLSEQASEVEALAAAQAAAAAADAADDSLARSVGLHLRGRTTFREGLLDEEDPARWVYHRGLKAAALSGNWAEAESIVEEMARAGHVPGPRAYHALVCAHAAAGDADGALGAIRRCWDAGVTPMPETYASVVSAAVAAGDLATAEAVVASNRRAGVDCTRSWQHLVVALLKAGEAEKGLEVLAQGEAEGLQLSDGVYEALIELHCKEGNFTSAQQVLAYMRAGINGAPRPGMQHYVPIINAQAEHGDPEVAFELLDELRLQGDFPHSMLGVCHTVVAAQLRAAQSIEEAKSHVLRMKTLMMRQGLQPGSPFFTAQLQTALRLDDLPTAVQAFKALRQRSGWALGGLTDEELSKLLLLLSRADLPAELHEVLAVMCREERAMPAAAMAPDAQGCTILGAWVKRRMDQTAGLSPAPSASQADQDAASLAAAAAAGPRSCLFIDGVAIDPQSLSCVDAGSGAVLAVSRMGVRELRAELAARKAPVSGNKKELAKRVQKLRQLDDARAALQQLKADAKKEEQRKMRVIVTDAFWHDGRLVQESRYEDEMEVEAEKEEEEEDAPDWGGEEEEAGRRTGGEEEPLDADEEVPFSDSLDRERYVLPAVPLFTSPQASAFDGAVMLLGAVVDLLAAPSASDLQLLTSWAVGSGNVAAAAYLLAAIHALGDGPLQGQVPAAVLDENNTQLAELCAAQGFDPTSVVNELLKDKVPNPEEADPLGRSYQDMFAITF